MKLVSARAAPSRARAASDAARFVHALTIALAIIGATGCRPVKRATVEQDFPPEFPGKRPEQIEVLTEPPSRPFNVLQPLEVECEMKTETTRDPWTLVPVSSQTGGCTYREALGKATWRAAKRNADGIYSVHTTAASNGKITLLLATPFRYVGPAPLASSSEASAAAAPSTSLTIEQRLQRLKDLRDRSVITPEEYEQRRREILKEM